MKKTRLMVTGSFIGLAIMGMQPAFAQTADETTPDADEESVDTGAVEGIVVTGSRIRRPNLE